MITITVIEILCTSCIRDHEIISLVVTVSEPNDVFGKFTTKTGLGDTNAELRRRSSVVKRPNFGKLPESRIRFRIQECPRTAQDALH